MRSLVFLLSLLLGILPGLAAAEPRSVPTPASAAATQSSGASGFDLPKLGLAGGVALPLWKAHFIGRFIYREIQGEDGVLNDPLVAHYVDYLGHRLSSVAHAPDEPFHYFVIEDPNVNAFALPGAYVGVYSGLILVTRHEDELAGVLAHETAHVVQRHIARSEADSSYEDIINLGILLGGLIVAASGVGMGAVMAAQGSIIQREINYTRADEMEADRVGIGILAKARFNPQGMVQFFQYMQRQYAFNGYNIPEFISTHPLDLTRISEAEMRADNLHVDPTPENPSYALMRARVRVLLSNDLEQTLEYFKSQENTQKKPWYRTAAEYGEVLCLNRLDQGKEGLKRIEPLAKAHPDNMALQLAKAESLLAAGDTQSGLAALAADNTLYGSDPAAMLAYARALTNADQPRKVVALLEPGMRDGSYRYNPAFYQILGTAADKTGDKSLAYLAMAHYYSGRGQYRPAVTQLRLGLRMNNLPPSRRKQMEDMKKRLKAEHKQAKNMGLISRDEGP
ncbi:MAG: beta-barrel assembly-enhancing protease [Gammaproteobacteria bacterium]